MPPERASAARRDELSLLVPLMRGDGPEPVAVVVGEAGIGKSWLVAHAGAAAQRAGVLVLTGAALPLTEGLPLLPFADLLRRLHRQDGGVLAAAVLADAPSYVRAEVARLLPELAPPDGAADPDRDHGWQRHRLFAAIRDLVATLARHRSTCLVVEDLHWADAATLDLLTYLASSDLLTSDRATSDPGTCASPAPRLVVTARTDELGPDGELGAWLARFGRLPAVRRLDLVPLDREGTAEQIAGLVEGVVAPDLVTEVFTRTGGNPLFTEQLVAAGAVDDARDPGGTSPLPDTVREVLVGRAARAGPEAHQVLEVLAVSGRPLPEDALLPSTGLPTPRARAALTDLRRRDLVVLDTNGRFGLKHALLGEAVHAGMLAGRRTELHEVLAHLLAERRARGLAAEIAEHWRHAGRDAEELAWRVRAAGEAEAVSAPAVAAAQLRRAVELWDAVPPGRRPGDVDPPALYARWQGALEAAGAWVAARDVAEAGYARLGADADPSLRVALLGRLGRGRRRDDPEGAVVALREAVRLGRELPPADDLLRAVADLGTLRRMQGHGAELRADLETAVAQAAALGLAGVGLELTAVLAWSYALAGDEARAARAYADAWELVDPRRDAAGAAALAMWHTDFLLLSGRLADLVAVGRRAVDVLTAAGVGDSFHTVLVRGNLADGLAELGRLVEAVDVLAPVTAGRPTHDRWIVHSGRAALEVRRGRSADAAARWEALQPALPGVTLVSHRLDLAVAAVEVLTGTGRAREAVAHAAPVLDLLGDNAEGATSGRLLVVSAGALGDLAAAVPPATALPAGLSAVVERVRAAAGAVAVSPFVPGMLRPVAAADRATWEAEWTRVERRPDPDAWAAAAAAWDVAGRPHRAAHARFRQAEALLAHSARDRAATPALRAALDGATEYGALAAAITELAARARLTLAAPPPPPRVTGDPPPTGGLTPRELDVLRLVAHGRTNAEIGRTLYISTSTVGVHVSNVLRKLAVGSRVEAATVAERAGLLNDAGADLNSPTTTS